jgi:predicted  nucleic acid-binding Zn-ribbon protein
MADAKNKIRYIKVAIRKAEQPLETILEEVIAIEKQLKQLQLDLYGDPVKGRLDIDQPLPPANRLGAIGYEQKYSTATPTKTHRDSYEIAKEEITTIKANMENIYNVKMKALEKKLIQLGAPYTPGRGYEYKD